MPRVPQISKVGQSSPSNLWSNKSVP